jgi:hypothetical protein
MNERNLSEGKESGGRLRQENYSNSHKLARSYDNDREFQIVGNDRFPYYNDQLVSKYSVVVSSARAVGWVDVMLSGY